MSDERERSLAFDQLLRDARREAPSEERLGAVLAKLEGELGPLAPRPPAKSSLGSGVALGAVVALIAAVLLWPRSPDAPTPVHPPVEAASVEAVPVEAVEAVPVEAPIEVTPLEVTPSEVTPLEAPDVVAPPREAPARRPRLAEPPSEESFDDPGSELRAEMALLERAMTARDRGDLGAAREALAAHRTRFPEGRLTPDRERLLRQLEESASPAPLDDTAPTP